SAPVAEGSRVTPAWKSAAGPAHPFKSGFKLLRTAAATLPVLSGMTAKGTAPPIGTLEGAMGPMIVEVQFTTAAGIVVTGVKLNASPEHIWTLNSAGAFVSTGTAFTVTVTSTNGPGQPFADGVMRYTTVPSFNPSADVRT